MTVTKLLRNMGLLIPAQFGAGQVPAMTKPSHLVLRDRREKQDNIQKKKKHGYFRLEKEAIMKQPMMRGDGPDPQWS